MAGQEENGKTAVSVSADSDKTGSADSRPLETFSASVTNVARKREAARETTKKADTTGEAADASLKETAKNAKREAAPKEEAESASKEAAKPETVSTEETAKQEETAGKGETSRSRRTGSRRTAERSRTTSSERSAGIQEWIAAMPEGDTRRYLEDRILPQMDWYRKKSAECKERYIYLMWASIAVGAMIPVFSVFTDGGTLMKFWIALLGSAVTAINALLALHSYKDLWIAYRKTREDLLQTLYYYFNNAGIFDEDEPQETKDRRLIKICEERMEQEHGGWSSMLEK